MATRGFYARIGESFGESQLLAGVSYSSNREYHKGSAKKRTNFAPLTWKNRRMRAKACAEVEIGGMAPPKKPLTARASGGLPERARR